MPTQVGPYRIREALAEGSVTSLHRAEHERLGRVVLLKSLKATLVEGSPFAGEIDREAKILSSVTHPSLPRLLEVSPDTPPTWFALENVDGPTLANILTRVKSLEMTSALAMALEMAQGLAHLHTRHLVHGQPEPHGIVICRDGRVVLLDLSLAEKTTANVASRIEPRESVHGHRYLAPERIMGEPATPMSDVFSLGAILYEMLCGHGPWDEGKPTALELSRRIRSLDPAPLLIAGQRGPADVAPFVLRCLAKRPEERFEDGLALALALENILDSLSILPIPILVTRALALAGLGEALAEEKTPRRRKKIVKERPLRLLAQQLGGLLALIAGGAIVNEVILREPNVVPMSEERVSGAERGFLRVLAHPWAEVFVDGRLVDVTPMAKPIVVSAGRHYVTFKHPNAPDEQREIVVTSGQSVLVDVSMHVERRAGDAGTDASDDAAISP